MDLPPPGEFAVGGVLLNQLARRLLGALPAGRIVVAALLAMAAATAVLIIVQADVLASLLADAVLGAPQVGDVAGAVALLAGVLVARAGLLWCQQRLAQRASASMKSRLRRDVLSHTQALGPGWLSGQRGGSIATTLGRGLDALDPYFTGYFPQLFIAAVVPLAVLVRVGVADLASAVVICLTLPLIPIFGVLVGMQTKKATARQWRALERLGGQFLDLVAGLPTLRAFGRATAQAKAVRQGAEDHRLATMKTLRVAFLSALVLELVATLSVALVAVPVGLRLLGGSLDLHAALLVLLLAPEAYLPLRALGSQFHASTEGLEVADRAFSVLDTPSGRGPAGAEDTGRLSSLGPLASGAATSGAGWGDDVVMALIGVSVTYPGRAEPALDDVSLVIHRGERLALVGESGAGKSTLLGVLLGLVRPDAGRVIVSTPAGLTDLHAIDVDTWRRELAWVPQRPHLFARSVAANIALGRADATAAEIRRAAVAAHADDFIATLPLAEQTELGENGAGLSAGQRQRIALARAFVRDAPLLLLDEPTAGLDASSEAAVIEATRVLMQGRTVVSVAHRPAVVLDAHRVIRLDHGRIVAGAGPVAADHDDPSMQEIR